MTTSGIQAVLSWFGCCCNKFLSKRQVLDGFLCLVAALDTPTLIDVFKVAGLLLKLTFLRTDFSKAERLTIPNRDFVMMWVATIHLEVLMSVRGLDMHVGAYQAIPQVDSCIKEGHFIG